MGKPFRVAVVGLVVFVAAAAYLLTFHRAPGDVREQLSALRDLVVGGSPENGDAEPEPSPDDAAPEPSAPAAARPTSAPQPPVGRRPEAAPPTRAAPTESALGSEPEPLPAAAGAPAPQSHYLYLSGLSSWTPVDVVLTTPLVIRSAGAVSTAGDTAGPNGIADSNYERQLEDGQASELVRRVLPSAPYLALIGRVCSTAGCSDPFLVGRHHALCAENGQRSGTLQLWTNNYVQVDGGQALRRADGTAGGFWLYVEPASRDACGGSGSEVSPAAAGQLGEGQVLQQPEFAVSSTQVSWRPFFLPLNQPLRIRGTGQIQPTGLAQPSGPDGVVAPNTGLPEASPSTKAGPRLVAPELPYLALIGRRCHDDDCGRPFLVGADRVLCPEEQPADRLELWVNRALPRPSLMSETFPLSMATFDAQTRLGEYRFEVSRAPAGACAR